MKRVKATKAKKEKPVPKFVLGNRYILWFEYSLSPDAEKRVKELSEKLGVQYIHGVRVPSVVQVSNF